MTIKFSGGVAATGPIKAEVNIAPIWVTPAGTVGSFEELTDPNFQFDATDPEGGSLTYSVLSGSLPAGLSLSSSGLLSGTASDVGEDTTSGFTLRVTDEGGLFQDRTFSMEITDFIIIPNMWSWGRADLGDGVLGQEDNINRSSPVAIGSSQTWAQIGLGQYAAFAVEGDGTLWSWGKNHRGQLGHGNVINRSSPVQVGGLTDWSNAIIDSSAQGSSVVIKFDNTMWVWGRNHGGQLGLGNTTDRSSPVQVSGGSIWSTASTGGTFMLAIKTNGTMWSCGFGSSGKLGLGDINNRSILTQIGSNTNWSKVSGANSNSIAVKTDGTLWGWGTNSLGELGLGDTINRSSPVQIGNSTNWININHKGNHVLVINSLGELWGWGLNNTGNLGDGTTIWQSSPVQIGSDTNWQNVNGGASFGHAIKTDGTLWSWGNNNRGSLGLGNTTNYSSPVQIGTLTDWIRIIGSGNHVMGLRNTL